jgi:hypothetical protein
MEHPRITLRTKDRDFFSHGDDYGGVTDAELEALLQQSRELVLSLETELENRQSVRHGLPEGIRESCKKLYESAGNIRILGRLNDRDAKLAKAASIVMTVVQTNRGSKVYQVFLLDILRQCGRTLVLLCAASLGKQRVIALNEQSRTSLVHYVKTNMSSLNSPALDLLATEYGMPHENSELCKNSHR